MSQETTLPPPAGTENAAPASSEWKAYVPSGDRRIVLSAIDSQLNAAKTAWKERNINTNANADDKPASNTGREDFFINCIDQTGESLKRQLDKVTIPADEAQVERALEEYQNELIATRPSPFSPHNNHSTIHDDDDDDSLSSVDNEDEDIEFDDTDILDQDAYNQVKQLRTQAREISARVISIREETAGKALEMSRRNLSELMRAHGFAENTTQEGGEEGSSSGEQQQVDDNTTNKSRETSLIPMDIALQTLKSSLESVDSNLAEKLESIKETIGTIDSSVEKYQRMSQGDTSALSQTEKALLANAEPREGVLLESEEDVGGDMDDSTNPDMKLARLLAGVL